MASVRVGMKKEEEREERSPKSSQLESERIHIDSSSSSLVCEEEDEVSLSDPFLQMAFRLREG